MLESIFNSPHVFYCKVQSDNPRQKTFVRPKTGCVRAKIGLTGQLDWCQLRNYFKPCLEWSKSSKGLGKGKEGRSLEACLWWSQTRHFWYHALIGQLSQHAYEHIYSIVVRFLFTWLSAMIVPIYYFTLPKVSLVGDLRVADNFVFE